jgi:hypothetical protein
MGRCGRTRVLPLKGLLLASGQLEERGEKFRRVSIHMAKGSGPTPQWDKELKQIRHRKNGDREGEDHQKP